MTTDKPSAADISKMLEETRKQFEKAYSDPDCSQYVMIDIDTYKRIQDMTPEDYENIRNKFFKEKTK